MPNLLQAPGSEGAVGVSSRITTELCDGTVANKNTATSVLVCPHLLEPNEFALDQDHFAQRGFPLQNSVAASYPARAA